VCTRRPICRSLNVIAPPIAYAQTRPQSMNDGGCKDPRVRFTCVRACVRASAVRVSRRQVLVAAAVIARAAGIFIRSPDAASIHDRYWVRIPGVRLCVWRAVCAGVVMPSRPLSRVVDCRAGQRP
jgi:hypothetical protein